MRIVKGCLVDVENLMTVFEKLCYNVPPNDPGATREDDAFARI